MKPATKMPKPTKPTQQRGVVVSHATLLKLIATKGTIVQPTQPATLA